MNPPDYEIRQGDCRELLAGVEAESVDLVLTSPPYDSIRTYGGDWSLDLPALGEQLFRVAKDGGICAVVMQDGTKDFAKSLSTFRLAVDWCDRVGWRLFECCIWQRHGTPGPWWNQRFRIDHEYLLFFLKGERLSFFDKTHLAQDAKYGGTQIHGTQRLSNGDLVSNRDGVLPDTKCGGTIWPYSSSKTENDRVKLQHPATFPDALASDIIRCFCPPGGLVLDPMVGSGTTCVAALENGRRSIGLEINPEYCEIARRRLGAAQPPLALA